MSREELVILLDDLVRRRQISVEEAAALLARFDAGDLPADWMPAGEDRPGASEWAAALILVLLLTGGNATRRLTAVQRTRARNLLRLRFQANVGRIGTRYASRSIGVAVWQQQMQTAIKDYSLRMAAAGAGTMPGAAVQARILSDLARQRVFLRRFAIQLTALERSDREMSRAALIARSRLYGSSGWASFWIGQGDGLTAGFVERWISLDDNSTCSVCAQLSGQLFLPGEGPMPGTSCLGSGNCRCRREPEYNPAEYARLTGQKVAA